MSTSDVAAMLLALTQDERTPLAYPAYLTAWDNVTGANTVQSSGGVTFSGLAYLGNPADIVVGRILLLNVSGKPVILANLRTPTA